MSLEHGVRDGYIEYAISPQIELFQCGCGKALAGFFIQGAKVFGKQAFQDCCGLFGLAFEFALEIVFELAFAFVFQPASL